MIKPIHERERENSCISKSIYTYIYHVFPRQLANWKPNML